MHTVLITEVCIQLCSVCIRRVSLHSSVCTVKCASEESVCILVCASQSQCVFKFGQLKYASEESVCILVCALKCASEESVCILVLWRLRRSLTFSKQHRHPAHTHLWKQGQSRYFRDMLCSHVWKLEHWSTLKSCWAAFWCTRVFAAFSRALDPSAGQAWIRSSYCPRKIVHGLTYGQDRKTDMCTRKMFDLLLTKETFVINVWAFYKLDLLRKVKVGERKEKNMLLNFWGSCQKRRRQKGSCQKKRKKEAAKKEATKRKKGSCIKLHWCTKQSIQLWWLSSMCSAV